MPILKPFLQEELDLTPPNKAAMLNLPPQKKWQIYCSRKGGEDVVDQAHVPEHYIERLQTLARVLNFNFSSNNVLSQKVLKSNQVDQFWLSNFKYILYNFRKILANPY